MKHWIYPANPKYYDIVAAFTEENQTAWPMNSNVELGDYVYIYSGAPYKQILFKCEVIKINVLVEKVMDQSKKYARTEGNGLKKKFMLLKTIHKFDKSLDNEVSFKVLRNNGLNGSIMGPQCLENNKALFDYIINIK